MWRDDERGQALQIGAVLLFGALVIALAGYQAFVVPQQNERVEFSHSQTVQSQLQDLRNALVSVPGESATRSVSVQLGTRYPSRLVAVNPGPPTGTLRTRATGDPAVNVSVANAVADGEAGDVWNGTQRAYTTGWLWYSPNYNVYDGAPTTYYGSSVLFNEFPSGPVTLTGQTLVDGDRVSLVALDGSVDRTSAGAFSTDVRPVSASTRTVAVESESGENVTVRIPTRLPLSTWRELLADETVDEGGHVVADELRTEPLPGFPGARILVVELESGVTYDLQLAKAGVGGGVTATSEAYVTDVSGNGSSVPEAGTQTLVVEVRDDYNNPVSGVTVEAATDGPGTVTPASATTDGDGRVALTYDAPANIDGDPQTVDVDASIDTDPGSASTFDQSTPENVTFTVEVTNTDGSGTGGGDSVGPTAKQASANRTTVTQGEKFELTTVVTDVGRGGTDILEAEFWSNRSTPGGSAGNGFAMSAKDGEFDMANETVTRTVDTDGWTVGVHRLSVRGRDANENWGSQSDINVTVTASSMAASTTVVSSSKTGSSNQRVTFTLENTGSSSVTIQTITVDSAANGDVAQIGNGTRNTGGGPPSYSDDGPELRSDQSGSLLDTSNPFSLDSAQSLDSTSSISAGAQTEYTLAEFRDSDAGGGNEVDPGSQITITLGFSDGSEKTVTLNL